MTRLARDLLCCDSGTTAAERSLIAGGVAKFVVGTMTPVGIDLARIFQPAGRFAMTGAARTPRPGSEPGGSPG